MTTISDIDRDFADLVDRLLDRVYRYLRNLTRDEDDARALCHDTFLKLRRRLDLGQELSEAYVFAAARNTALSAWRRNQSSPDTTGGDPWTLPETSTANSDTNPDRSLERQELREALEGALARLTEEHRTVFLLAEIDGLKHGEIAEVLGVPEGTVASRKHHATAELRRILERSGHALR